MSSTKCDIQMQMQKEKERETRDHLKHILEEELRKGLEITSQLKSLLVNQPQLSDYQQQEAKTLAEGYSTAIINSFDKSLALAKNYVHMKPSSSSSLANLTLGCPRKTSKEIVETQNLTADGYTWRKYGNKRIRNSQHPREYYRCAYKEEMKCQAIKQVQKISDNPPNYLITYLAKHTCQQSRLSNNIKAASNTNIMESNIDKDNKNAINTNFILNFESKNPTLSLIIPQNFALHPSSISNHVEVPSSLTTKIPRPKSHASRSIINELKQANDASTLLINEPKPAHDDIGCVNYLEPLLSPTIITNPTYMCGSIMEKVEDYTLMMVDDSYGMSDALFQDIPLWDWDTDDVPTA